jgi:hypothetical protein
MNIFAGSQKNFQLALRGPNLQIATGDQAPKKFF